MFHEENEVEVNWVEALTVGGCIIVLACLAAPVVFILRLFERRP